MTKIPAKPTSPKAAKKKKTVKKKTVKKRKVNKSAVIREYAEKNPDAGPTAIANALSAKGIKVVAPQVSNVLALAKKKVTSKKKKSGGATPASGDSVSLSALVQAQQFADKVGGVDTAKQLLGAVEKLSK